MAPIRCCFDQTAVWHSDAARGPSTPSFNHLVGAREQSRRHLEAQGTGGLQVDDEFVLGRGLYRQVGGLLAPEDAVDVARGVLVLVDVISPIGDQAAAGDEEAIVIHRREFVPRHQRDDQMPMNRRPPAWHHDQTAIRGAREGRDDTLDLGRLTQIDRVCLYPKRGRHGLDSGKPTGSDALCGIAKNRDPRHGWRDLFEQLQPLPAEAIFINHKAGNVSARTGRDSTKPPPTGSAATGNTIGTVRVVSSNGRRADAPCARITSGASATNSAARLRISSALFPAQCVSMRTLRPMIQPDFASPWWNAPSHA